MDQSLIKLAHQMADTAGDIARRYYRSGFTTDIKDDASPVTVADRAIEMALRNIVEHYRPDDGIVGEEFGVETSTSGYTWVFDPIDGTKSFTIGRPTFGTLIALCEGDKPILGIIDQPILKERWIGAKGEPTLFNGQPVKTRPCPALARSVIGTGSASQIGVDLCSQLEESSSYMVYQGDCYFYGLLANGWMDACVEHHLKVYDYLALVPVIEGAGGKVTDWDGNELTLRSGPTLAAAGDPALHDYLLTLIQGNI
jgi:histidinol phosphatase-like enzyme (inositol monophosphatase family)